jgi:hypothetical protein
MGVVEASRTATGALATDHWPRPLWVLTRIVAPFPVASVPSAFWNSWPTSSSRPLAAPPRAQAIVGVCARNLPSEVWMRVPTLVVFPQVQPSGDVL